MSGKFSTVHGQNVTLSNDLRTATWDVKESGSWACSLVPLEPGQTVEVRVEGSCHCDLGFIKTDPRRTEISKRLLQPLNEISTHKRSCTVSVLFHTNGLEIASQYQGNVMRKSIERLAKPWLMIYVKFGEASVQVFRNDVAMQFSDNHGPNVELLDQKCVARTISQTPAAVCFIKEKISTGDNLTLSCSPVYEGSREPSRYSVGLMVYDTDPEHLKKDFKYMFEARASYSGDPPVTSLEILEKKDCKGIVTVSVVNSSTVSYRTASGRFYTKTLTKQYPDGVWLIMSLYRTRVTLMRAVTVPMDQIDAVIREPSNELAENTMDYIDKRSLCSVTELKRCFSEYEYACEPVQGELDEKDIKERLTAFERSQQEIVENQRKIYQTLKSMSQNDSPEKASLSNLKNTTDDRIINFQKNYSMLVSDIDGGPLRDKLYENEIITAEELEKICCERTPTEENRLLLRILLRKQVKKSAMDKVLDESCQGHLKHMF